VTVPGHIRAIDDEKALAVALVPLAVEDVSNGVVGRRMLERVKRAPRSVS